MNKKIIAIFFLLLPLIFLYSAFSDYFPMDPENINSLADALYATAVCDPGVIAAQKTLDARMELLADSIVKNEVVPHNQRDLRDDLTQEIVQMVKPQLYYNLKSVADIPLLSVKKTKFILSQDGNVTFKYKQTDNYHGQVCFMNDGAMTWNDHFYCRVKNNEKNMEFDENYYLSSSASTGNWGCCDFDVSYLNYPLGQHSLNVSLYNEYGHKIDYADVYWQVLTDADLEAEQEMRVTEVPDFLIVNKTSFVAKVGNTDKNPSRDFVPVDELYMEVCYQNSGYITWNKDYFCDVISTNGLILVPDGQKLGKDVKPGEWGCFSFRRTPSYNTRLGEFCPVFQLYTDYGVPISNGQNSVCFMIR